jgi:subtilase family serine protease
MEISTQIALRAREPITTATLAANQPSKDAVAALRRNFEDAGFRLGPYAGISFSISGQASLLERYFGTRFEELKSYELQLESVESRRRGID